LDVMNVKITLIINKWNKLDRGTAREMQLDGVREYNSFGLSQ